MMKGMTIGFWGIAMSLSVSAANFVTDGNAIRTIKPGQMGDQAVLFLGELDGGVACYSVEGEKLWHTPTKDPAVLFEIEAADLDGDGRDELLTASGNGAIRCWNSDGSERWSFRGPHKIRFNEVAVLKRGKNVKVFAGGNDKVIYVLDADGNLIAEQAVPGAVRKLEIGEFQKAGEPLLFAMSMAHDKSGWISFELLNPDNLSDVRKSLPLKKRPKNWRGIFTEIRVQDLDQDGLDDLVTFINEPPKMIVLNGQFEEVAYWNAEDQKATRRFKQRYAHATGLSLLPVRNEILFQFGRTFYILNSDGTLKDWLGDTSARFPISDFCLHPEGNRLFGAGSISGDNAVYEFDLSKEDWWKDNGQWIGRMAEVTQNLEKLYDQVLDFEVPAYQKPSGKPWVMGYRGHIPEEVAALDFNPVVYVGQETWSENHDRTEIEKVVGEEWAKRRDKRQRYQFSQEDLLGKVRAYEAAGTPFNVWAGHGNDPFYVSIDTLEKMLEAAPTTLYGFIYAEMANTSDPRVNYFINHYLPRLAKACRKQGRAKLQFRYKQTFWATTIYAEPWTEMFLSGKYSDILVPATEDTNSTTQELNHAGRIGMFAGGYVEDYGMRLIDDNPTGWRPLAPGRQKSISPFLRSGVIRAAYGARYGINWTFNGMEGPELELLFAMMGSGVIPQAKAEDIVSIASWHLMDGIPVAFEKSQHSGHSIDTYDATHVDAIYSVSQVYWGGASVPEWDYTKLLGTDYRWLNFMPRLPHGMIPIAPVEYGKKLAKAGVPFSVGNGKAGLKNGKSIPAEVFGGELRKTAEAGAAQLPVLVDGASWSAIRLDDKHIRVILVDSHYIDPRDCPVVVSFPTSEPISAVDILSGETLSLEKGQLELTVPAGSMRFIDIVIE